MKASYAFAAATLLACATTKPHHAHEAYHNKVRAPVLEQRNVNASCGCVTSYTTFYGEATRMNWHGTLHAKSVWLTDAQ